MPLDKLLEDLKAQLAHLEAAGTAKADEQVVVAVKPPQTGRGPRFLLEDFGDREFILMNSNSYLGLSLRSELIEIRLRRALLSRDLAPPDDAGNAESFSQQLLEAFFQLIRVRFAVVQQSHNFTTQIGESWQTGNPRR